MNKWLRRFLKGLGILVGVLVLLFVGIILYVQATWNNPVDRPAPQMAVPDDPEIVARGEHLYKYAWNCWGCHGSQGGYSPEESQSGGREFDMTGIGPGFGFVFAKNITPDPATGIGDWSDGELVRALREGLDREGRLIFPIMPAPFYHGMSDDDALSLVAYLRSLPAVRNEVPEQRLSFIAKVLISFRVVKPEPPITEPVKAPPKGVTAEYGKYLAWNASGCAECHVPRDPNTGIFDVSRPFAGGLFPFPEEGFSTTGTNLTPDPETGIGDWTEEQFLTAMRTGVRPDGTVMIPFMPWPLYSQWGDDDLRSVWLYLRSLEPITHEVPPSTLTGVAATGTGTTRGEALYDIYCRICHGTDGADGPFTSIYLRDAADGLDEATVTRFISEGIPGTSMPGFAGTFTSEQIADLVKYIRTLSQ
jgi:mono/diheme cytochrome c family protein